MIRNISCDLPPREERYRQNTMILFWMSSTASFFIKEGNATNVEQAVFGPNIITWTNNFTMSSITRTISRIDLSFVQDVDIAGSKTHEVGQCSLLQPFKSQILEGVFRL
jgi:hypothetical protein